MVMAFCLENVKRENGKYEMTLAGSVNLDDQCEPPKTLLLAAGVMKVPGFDLETLLDHLEVPS
jgi:hypothetical protein